MLFEDASEAGDLHAVAPSAEDPRVETPHRPIGSFPEYEFPPLFGISPFGTSPETGTAASSPALFALDGDGRLSRASLGLARLVGARVEDLVGSALAERLDPFGAAELQERLLDLHAGAHGVGFEATLRSLDASRVPVRVELLGGEPPYAGTVVPRTDALALAASLGERTLLDALPQMTLLSDAQGKPLFSNLALRRRFGRPMIAGVGGVSTIHHEDRSGLQAAWQEALVARTPFAHEMRMAPFGEPFRWMRQETVPRHNDTGQVLMWISTLADIEEERATQAALTESRRFVARFAEASPDVMFLFDLREGRQVYCSDACGRVLGYTAAEMMALGSEVLPTIVHPEDWGWISAEIATTVADPDAPDEQRTVEFRMVRKDGETIWVSTRSLVFERSDEGCPTVTMGVIQDITARRLAETERDDHIRILEHALSGVGVVDPEGRYLYANARYGEIVGRSPSDLVGSLWTTFVHEGDLPRMRREYDRMMATGRAEIECRGIRPDGTTFHQHVVMIPKTSGGTFLGHYRFKRDVTERVRFQTQLESQLAHISSMTAELEQRSSELERANAVLALQAGSDGLTGLANHRVLQETLAGLNDAGRAHSLLLLDVDHFKAYNDAFGHPAGDLVLREFALVLGSMTTGAELAARYGGEEFAVVLPDVDLEGAEVRAGLILQRAAEVAWPHRPITASVGCAVWSPGRSRADLVEAADRALYISKRNGRNRVTAAA